MAGLKPATVHVGMIKLFKIPPYLAIDIRAYWSKKNLHPVKEEGTVATNMFLLRIRNLPLKKIN